MKIKTKPIEETYANEWGIDPRFVAYDKKHDSYYDRRDGLWLDGPCGDPDCGFCADRPKRVKVPS